MVDLSRFTAIIVTVKVLFIWFKIKTDRMPFALHFILA